MLYSDILWPHYFFDPINIYLFLQLKFVMCLFWVCFLLSLTVMGHLRDGGLFQTLCVLAGIQTTLTVPGASLLMWINNLLAISRVEKAKFQSLFEPLFYWEPGRPRKFTSKNILYQNTCFKLLRLIVYFLFLLDFWLLIWLLIAIIFHLTNFYESVSKLQQDLRRTW